MLEGVENASTVPEHEGEQHDMTNTRSTFGNLADGLTNDPPVVALDETDIKLLAMLQDNARATLKSLADAVGLTAPAVSERMAQMKQEGVIRGYRVDIDWRALGYTLTTYLSVVIRTGASRDEVVTALQSIPEVEETSVVTGASDLILRIRSRGFDHLKRIIAEHVWARDDLEFTETRLAFFSDSSAGVEQHRLDDLLSELRASGAA